jgi:hypothetical protein
MGPPNAIDVLTAAVVFATGTDIAALVPGRLEPGIGT